MASSGVPYVLVPSLLEVATFAPSTPVPVKLLQRDACSSVHDGSIVPISRSEADAISAWLSSRLNAFTGPVHLSLSRPTTATLDRVGGNSQSVAIGDALNKGLLRGLKTRRSLQVAELPHTLNDVGFGESVADAMKHLIHSHSQSTNQ